MSNKPTNNIRISLISDNRVYTNALTPIKVRSSFTFPDYSEDKIFWDFGDGNTAIGLSAEHTYTEEGKYKISAKALLTDGDVFGSNTLDVEAIDMIPNTIRWNELDYDTVTINSSEKSFKPFIFDVFNTYQYDSPIFDIDLYVHNSKSIPQNDQKTSHLNNNWSFYNLQGDRIEKLSLSPEKIYAYNDDGQIRLTTTEQISSAVYVGLSASGQFYYVDDTPSTLVSSFDLIEPVILVVTQNLSTTNSNFFSNSYINSNSIYKSLYVIQKEPTKLLITQDGYHNFSYIKHQNTRIPFTINLGDDFNNLIKSQPLVSYPVYGNSQYEISAFFNTPLEISSTPLDNLFLKEYVPEVSTSSGFVKGDFIILSTYDGQDIKLNAQVQLDYIQPANVVVNGWLTDQNGAKLYRVRNVYPLASNIQNQDVLQPVTEIEFPSELFSGIYGISVDKNYNSWVADASNSIIYIYDQEFQLLYDFDVSTYSNLISATSAPAQISIDRDYAYISLFDAGSVIRVDTTDFVIDTGWSAPFGQNYYIEEVGESAIQPSAIEKTNTNLLWVSYWTTLSGSEILAIDVTSTDTSSGRTVLSSAEPIIEILSNRSGEKVYLLGYHDNRVVLYESDNTLSGAALTKIVDHTNPAISSFGSAQFMTLDNNQDIWITYGSNLIYKYDSIALSGETISVGSSAVDISYIGGISSDHLNRLWVIHQKDRCIYYLNDSRYEEDIISKIDIDPSGEIPLSSYTILLAYGDWNGFQYYNKFANGQSVRTLTLRGESSPFRIFSEDGKYSISKINEDFDMEETIKGYRTTERMFEYDAFFTDFLGSIFGDEDETPDTNFGKRIYEKISNFVINHVDASTANIDNLKSMADMVGVDIGDFNFEYPNSLKRLIDILSIRIYKLFGAKYQNEILDTILGDELDFNTYLVSASPQVKLIAKEKFNNYYTIIEPIFIDDLKSPTYPLSSYSSSWGWGLSVGSGNNVVNNMYKFYVYNKLDFIKSNSILNYIDNFTTDSLSSLSTYADVFGENGVVDHLLTHNLKKGMGLFL